MAFASIPEILDDLRAGKAIVLVDDESRENEGDFVVAAEKMTVDEAFKAHEPNYVGPGEFLTVYSREMKERKKAASARETSAPLASEQAAFVPPAFDRKAAKKKPDVVVEDTVLPEGVTLI